MNLFIELDWNVRVWKETFQFTVPNFLKPTVCRKICDKVFVASESWAIRTDADLICTCGGVLGVPAPSPVKVHVISANSRHMRSALLTGAASAALKSSSEIINGPDSLRLAKPYLDEHTRSRVLLFVCELALFFHLNETRRSRQIAISNTCASPPTQGLLLRAPAATQAWKQARRHDDTIRLPTILPDSILSFTLP